MQAFLVINFSNALVNMVDPSGVTPLAKPNQRYQKLSVQCLKTKFNVFYNLKIDISSLKNCLCGLI